MEQYKRPYLDNDDIRIGYKEYPYVKIRRKTFVLFIFIAFVFCAVMLCINIVFNAKYQYIIVEDVSMQPTLNPNPIATDDGRYQDCVYVELTQDIDYGDIIIVDRSEEEKTEDYTVIKRALAFEGDQISIVALPVGENGQYELRLVRIKSGDNVGEIVYTGQDDDYIIYEDYILSYQEWTDYLTTSDGRVRYDSDFFERFLQDNSTTTHRITVEVNGVNQSYDVEFYTVGSDNVENEQDQVFYMGDNRVASRDSRQTGTCDHDKVVGKVVRIAHNGYSLRNDIFGWLDVVYDYLALIWQEIVNYFMV